MSENSFPSSFPDAIPVPKEGVIEKKVEEKIHSGKRKISARKDKPKKLSNKLLHGGFVPKREIEREKKEEIIKEKEPEISDRDDANRRKRKLGINPFLFGGCVSSIFITLLMVFLFVLCPSCISRLNVYLFNSDIYIPEVKEFDMKVVEEKLKVPPGKRREISMSEDEFNAWVDGRMNDNSRNIEIIGDFEKGRALLLVKFNKWMPWSIIELSKVGENVLEAEDIRIGPFDAEGYIVNLMQDEISTEEGIEQFDFTKLIQSLLFENQDVEIKEIYFLNDELYLFVQG